MATGKERAWDISLNGQPYRVVRDQKGQPAWRSASEATVGAKQPTRSGEEREWLTWHMGMGYSHFMYPGTYHYATAMDARLPRQIIMGPASYYDDGAGVGLEETRPGVIRDLIEYREKLYASQGGTVNLVNANDGSLSAAWAGHTVAGGGDMVVSGNSLLAGGYTAAPYLTEWDAVAETATTSGTVKAEHLCIFNPDSEPVLARSYNDANGNPCVSWCALSADVLTEANYSADYRVGETAAPITGLCAVDRTLFVAKTDGLYYVDASGRVPKIIDVPPEPVWFTYIYDSEVRQGRGLFADSSGNVWYPTTNRLLLYDPRSGSVWDVTPGDPALNAATLRGRPTCVVQYGKWFYVAVRYSIDSQHIYVGRYREEGEAGVGPVIWHGPILSVGTGSTQITSMVPSAKNPGRMWFNSGEKVRYFCVPTNADSPLDDSTYRYATTGKFYLSKDEMGVRGTQWWPVRFVIDNEGLTASTYIDVYIQRDDAATWTKIHSDHITTPGQAVVTPTAGTDWRFGRAALRLDVTNASATSTPKITAVTGEVIRRAAVRDVIECQVYCSDNVSSRYGIPTRRSGAQQITDLHGLEEGQPVALKDWWTGSERSRTVLVLPVRETVVKQQGDESVEQAVNLALVVLS
jgi:hypothetical protein